MSYDIELIDPLTGVVLELDAPHHMRGGTYAIGGTTKAHLNCTYNYYPQFRRVLDSLVEPRPRAPDWMRETDGPEADVREGDDHAAPGGEPQAQIFRHDANLHIGNARQALKRHRDLAGTGCAIHARHRPEVSLVRRAAGHV